MKISIKANATKPSLMLVEKKKLETPKHKRDEKIGMKTRGNCKENQVYHRKYTWNHKKDGSS